LCEARYADDAANRHVNPSLAQQLSDQLGELLREGMRA
jgi:hypothetical protein